MVRVQDGIEKNLRICDSRLYPMEVMLNDCLRVKGYPSRV
jgi:hypothetical protein